MMLLEAALLAILIDTPPPVKPPAPSATAAIASLSGVDLARALRQDIESIAGAGNVDVRLTRDTLYTVRITMPAISPEIGRKIYARELELRGLFPNLNFDFRYAAPELARAIKIDLEAISGGGTVDVSIDRETLFNVRIAVPALTSHLYTRIYERALEFYKDFPDLSFDFYLMQKPGA
jgi:hypothetical protein